MKDHLKSIGFYTLNDSRAQNSSQTSPLWRCELILTDKCNFKCPYCRGPKHERDPWMPYEKAEAVVKLWASEGLKNIRFSGGEPTLYRKLPELVSLAKSEGVERIAISTNGSAKIELYEKLIDCGVNDFSISLDAFSREKMIEMSGGLDVYDRLVSNIKEISKKTYVTVGMVFNEQNIDQAVEAVMFADSLGVSDIRVLSSAQYNMALENLRDLPETILDKYPILAYRINNFKAGSNVRGIKDSDTDRCKIVVDDMAVAGEHHFPCIIYLREGGKPVGRIDSGNVRQERFNWFKNHDTHCDPICKQNCLDVCVDFNNVGNRK